MKRRDFLKSSGYFVAAAALSGVGCGDNIRPAKPDGGPPPPPPRFPQGVASGDPRESSVVLWTRAVPRAGESGPVSVTVEVSDSDDFSNLVLQEELTLTEDSDYTLRLLVTDLAPGTYYYYRFIVGSDVSATGRTLTAPPSDDVAPVRLAWVSCQDYSAGFFGAYRELIAEDEARPAEAQVQFVVHLGDFIYETVRQGFQAAIDENFEPIELVDRQGEPRVLAQLPSGGTHARTLEDYRFLYQRFLSDPDLQAARARWPFVCTWDDHEFTNDAWQTQANYTNEGSLDEPAQTRKLAANQAWFEYVPAQLTGAEGVPGVPPAAADFQPAAVQDAPYSEVDGDNQVIEENNVRALESMTIYRSFRYGQNVELVLTDQRSYRSDHAVPEELTDGLLFFDPRNAMPKEVVEVFDQGMTANGGNPPQTVLDLPNPRVESPPGTMLGPEQKQWWKDTMRLSDATWKLWGNEVPLMRFFIKNEPVGILLADRVMNADAWDGYNTERKELMQYLRDNDIGNVVVITGDIHAHFAGLVMDDYDAATPTPVAAEFCAAGVASNSLFSFFEDATREQPPGLRMLITYDDTRMGGTDRFVNNLNVLLFHGTGSAWAAAQTGSRDELMDAKDPEVNPHLRFADTNSQGYGVMTVTPTEITATLVTVNRPISDAGTAGPGIKGTATFTVQKDQVADMGDPELTGVRPFPFS